MISRARFRRMRALSSRNNPIKDGSRERSTSRPLLAGWPIGLSRAWACPNSGDAEGGAKQEPAARLPTAPGQLRSVVELELARRGGTQGPFL